MAEAHEESTAIFLIMVSFLRATPRRDPVLAEAGAQPVAGCLEQLFPLHQSELTPYASPRIGEVSLEAFFSAESLEFWFSHGERERRANRGACVLVDEGIEGAAARNPCSCTNSARAPPGRKE